MSQSNETGRPSICRWQRPLGSSRQSLVSRPTTLSSESFLSCQPSPQQSGPVYGQSSRPSLPTAQSYSSPLSQGQWQDVPAEYRPPGWQESVSHPSGGAQAASAPFEWRLRQPSNDGHGQGPRTPSKPRRRPRALRNPPPRQSDDNSQADVTLLFPELSPCEMEHAALHSAPGEFEQLRSVSQPNTPSWNARRSPSGEQPPSALLRGPTLPRSSRRRLQSASGVQDAAFNNEAEFRLFAEATAGLSPQDNLRSFTYQPDPLEAHFQAQIEQQPQPPPQLPQLSHLHHQQASETFVSPLEQSACATWTSEVSPLEQQYHQPTQPTRAMHTAAPLFSSEQQTPTTIQAFQDLAGMPQATSPLQQHHRHQPSHPQHPHQHQHQHPRLQSSSPTPPPPFPRAHPHHRTESLRPETLNFEDLAITGEHRRRGEQHAQDFCDLDDELPDYVTSQAEAQAQKQTEAARRAQELQRRWREASGIR